MDAVMDKDGEILRLRNMVHLLSVDWADTHTHAQRAVLALNPAADVEGDRWAFIGTDELIAMLYEMARKGKPEVTYDGELARRRVEGEI